MGGGGIGWGGWGGWWQTPQVLLWTGGRSIERWWQLQGGLLGLGAGKFPLCDKEHSGLCVGVHIWPCSPP